MRFFRRVSRVAELLSFSSYCAARLKRSCRRAPEQELAALRLAAAKRWASGAAGIINMKIVLHGDPGAFHGGVVVANHQDFLDAVVFCSIFGGRFTPKVEMKSWPVLGDFTALGNPIWIDRSRRGAAVKAVEQFSAALRDRHTLILFPEGTSSDGSRGLLPFKSTVFEAAAATGCEILPVLVFYSCTSEPVAGNIAWPRAGLLRHIWWFLGLKSTRADVYFLDVVRPGPGEERRGLCARVYRQMNLEYERLRNEKLGS